MDSMSGKYSDGPIYSFCDETEFGEYVFQFKVQNRRCVRGFTLGMHMWHILYTLHTNPFKEIRIHDPKVFGGI